MSAFLEVLGEDALRKGVWKLAAAAIGVAATVFFAGAIAAAAWQTMPPYAALVLAGMFLAAISLICILLGQRTLQSGTTPTQSAPALGNAALSLLSKTAAESPTKSVLAGLAAGAAFGLLDSLDNRKK